MNDVIIRLQISEKRYKWLIAIQDVLRMNVTLIGKGGDL